MLANPEIESRVKGDILSRIAEGADELVVNFVRLLAQKGRADALAGMADEFDALIAADARILDVELTTAHALSDTEFRRHPRPDRESVGPEGPGDALGRRGPDRRARPAGRIDAAGRQRARTARTTSPRTRNRKELTTREATPGRDHLDPEGADRALRRRDQPGRGRFGAAGRRRDRPCPRARELRRPRDARARARRRRPRLQPRGGQRRRGALRRVGPRQGRRPGPPHREGRVGAGRPRAARPRRRSARESRSTASARSRPRRRARSNGRRRA